MQTKKKSIEPTAPRMAPSSSTDSVASVLGNDDLLSMILLCLGLPTLLHVVLVSKHWLQVISDPTFLRRFRCLHPPPILGFYMEMGPSMRFVPLPQLDPELARLVTPGPFETGENHVANVLDFRNGRLLLKFFPAGPVDLAIYSPLHPERRRNVFFPRSPSAGRNNFLVGCVCLCRKLRLLPDPEDGGDGTSCIEVRLKCRRGNGRIVWAHVSDLQAGVRSRVRCSELVILPESMLHNREGTIPQEFLSLSGKLYVPCMRGHLLVIDLASVRLSCIKLPGGMAFNCGKGLSRANGGSGIYLIHPDRFHLYVWHYDTTCSTASDWTLVDKISLRKAIGDLADPISYIDRVSVHLAVVGDDAEFVFLKVNNTFFCMHVRSRKVEKVYELITHLLEPGGMQMVYPLMTPWPPTFQPSMTDMVETTVDRSTPQR